MELLNTLNTLCRNICKTGKVVLESVQSGEIDLEEVKDGQNPQIFELKQLMNEIIETAQKLVDIHTTGDKKDDYLNLLTSINKSSPLVQEFLDSLESCCSNPYDFSLQQNMQLLYSKILSTFNESLNFIELLLNGDSTQMEEILQNSAKNAVFNIRTLAELLHKEDRSIEEFSKAARLCFESLISLKSIVITHKSIPRELVDKFGRLTPLLIKCAKEAFMKPEDLESNKNFDLMKQGIAKFIHQFLTYSTPSSSHSSPSSTPSTSPSSSPRSDSAVFYRGEESNNNNSNNNLNSVYQSNSTNSLIRNHQIGHTQSAGSAPEVIHNNNNNNTNNTNNNNNNNNNNVESLSQTVPGLVILQKQEGFSVSQTNKASKSHSDLSNFTSSVTPRRSREERSKEKKKRKEKVSSKTVGDGTEIKRKKKREEEIAEITNEITRSKSNSFALPVDRTKKAGRIPSHDGQRSMSISQPSDYDEREERRSITPRLPSSKSELVKDTKRRPQSRHDMGTQIKQLNFSSSSGLRKKSSDDANSLEEQSSSALTVMQYFFSKFPSLQEDFANSSLDDQTIFRKELSNIMLLCGLEDSFFNSNLILSKSSDSKSFDPVKKFGSAMTRLLGISYTTLREADVSLNTSNLEKQFRQTFLKVVETLYGMVKIGSTHLSIQTLKDIHEDILESINKLKTDDLEVHNDDPVLQSCKKHNIGQIDGLVRQNLWYRTHSVRMLSSQIISTMIIILSTKTTITQNIVVDLNSTAVCLANYLSSFYTVLKLSIETTKLKISNNFLNSATQESMEELLDIDIWTWREREPVSKDPTSTISSLNSLIEALTSDVQYDANFMKTFICTYQSFTSPCQLLSKLKQRFFYPASISPQRGSAIQMRVCVVLKYWVQHQFNDFDDNLVNSLFEFLENSVKKSGHPQLADIIIVQLLEKTRERQFELENKVNAPPAPLENIHLSCIESIPELLFKYSPKEVAEQMTLIDMNYFKSIQPTELMKQAWNSNSLKWKAINVTQLMDRLNTISYWLSTLILSFESVPARVKAFEWFYDVAINLRRLNNYHSVMGFVVGFNISGINRLKHTLESVDPKLIKQFSAIEELMSPSSSFKNYRKQLNVMKLPAIPYLGVHLTDLVFIEDGNPDEIDTKINFPKRELVFKTISEIQVFQQSSYEFPVLEPINKLLQILPCCSEKQLYKLSLLREPRG